MNNKSKYSRADRKHIVKMIENLKNNEDYLAIFEILLENGENSYMANSNGVFLNLSTVSDEILDKISKYIKKINKKNKYQIEVDIDIIPNIDEKSEEGVYKLSNYEKNILKQHNLKKVLNEEKEYQEFDISAKKINNKKNKNISDKVKISKNTSNKVKVGNKVKISKGY